MRCRLALRVLAIAAALVGCDADGTARGGESLIVDPCSTSDLAPTWTNLYACYFGPSGKASCAAQGICHGGPTQTGAITSGFICGSTAESCWQGMTMGLPGCDAGSVADAEIEASSGDAGAIPSIDSGVMSCTPPPPSLVPTGGASDPTTTTLWSSLRGAGGVGLHNMPYTTGSGGFTFSQQDLNRISAWIHGGAPND